MYKKRRNYEYLIPILGLHEFASLALSEYGAQYYPNVRMFQVEVPASDVFYPEDFPKEGKRLNVW